MRTYKMRVLTGCLMSLALVSAGCMATQQPMGDPARGASAAGFFYGLWHGMIAPIGFVVSLLSDGVRIYAAPNAGRWYDFGFMLGIGGFSHGLLAGSRRSTRSRRERPVRLNQTLDGA